MQRLYNVLGRKTTLLCAIAIGAVIAVSILALTGCDNGTNTGGNNTGGNNTGGNNTGGNNTGGNNTGGDNTGGNNTGGSNTGGNNTGGNNTGGNNTGGDNTGGNNTGGDNTGGNNTGGNNTGGDNTGGNNTGGNNTGGSNTGGDNAVPKSITITGLSGGNGQAVMISITDGSSVTAVGQGTISNDSLTVSLKDSNGNDWTGTGSYYLVLSVEKGDGCYTNGKTLQELGIFSIADLAKLPKYTITAATSTIALSDFQEIPEDWQKTGE